MTAFPPCQDLTCNPTCRRICTCSIKVLGAKGWKFVDKSVFAPFPIDKFTLHPTRLVVIDEPNDLSGKFHV